MQTVTVINLRTDEEQTFIGITPHEAVVAAHAQSLGDFNSWEYGTKYRAKVGPSGRTVFCGDWGCMLRKEPAQLNTMSEVDRYVRSA